MAFNLTAQLNLQGPTNVKQIAAQIKKDLGNINANITFKLDPAVTKNVTALSSALKGLNATFGSTTTSATSAAAAIKAFGNSINSVKINNVPQQINAAANAVNKLNKASASSAKDLGSAAAEMQEFGKQAGLAIRRFVAFSTVTSVIYGLTNSISQGVQAFIDYDKELVKLQQVTGESSAGLAKLQEQITTLSTTFGVSSKDLTSVASTLAQAGLSARETEKALRALALSSLAPSFDDMNETVEGSIALMRQFGISADDLEGALGAVNTVAARFAVESSDIITAVQRTGSVFATASKGVSEGKDALNEFIAVFTSVRATTRESAETIATGLRTIFTRIQRGTTIDALKEFGVNLTDTEGKFVGAYKAVELLSKGLSGIDPRSLQFSKIVEELGGFRQIGKVIPLIQQFTVAQDALKTAQAGQGSLAKDAATAQLSLANQISKVRQEFFALFREIGQSKGFQSLIRGALSLASGLIKVTDAVKGILPALAIITAFKGAKALTQFASGFSSGVKRGPDGKANGGVIRKFARGGVVPGTGSGDTVPAMLEPGEFVIRKKAVETIGTDNLHSMNKYGSGGSIRAGGSNKRKRFAKGGKAKIASIDKIEEVDDGDTFDALVTPTAEPFIASFRLSNIDAYELPRTKKRDPLDSKKTSAITESKWNSIAQFNKGKNPVKNTSLGGGAYDILPNFNVDQNRTVLDSANDAKTELINVLSTSPDVSNIDYKTNYGFGRYGIDLPGAISEKNTTGRFVGKNLGGKIQRFMVGGKAKETRSFGSGDFPFPKRISNAYFKEIDAKLNKEQVDKAFSGGSFLEYPEDFRFKVDQTKATEAFDSVPFDRNQFADSFKTKLATSAIYRRMSDFAKFIGLPKEDLSLALPSHIDFTDLGLKGLGQFDRTGMGTKSVSGYDLSGSGYTQANDQDLYGYEKLVAEKQKEFKKIIKTPVKTFDDGSFSYDEELAKKTWDEINDLQMKISNTKKLKNQAELAAMDQMQATAKSTGRGAITMSTGRLSGRKNDTFYHEMTHQLFQGLRTRSAESFDKYKSRVVSLFSGDNNDLADAFDALESSYNSSDVVYGRSYKVGTLDQIIQQNRSINRGSRPAKTPEAAAAASTLWAKSLGIKKARDFKPVNPEVNQALLDNSISQSYIDRIEDSGKEEFLTTLVQNAPRLDSNLQGALDSTLTDLLGSAGIQRQTYAVGGKVERKIGIIDTDVLRDPANASIVDKAMEKLGITDVSDYTTKLGELSSKARKTGFLSKLTAIAGAAGSGKSSLATGLGANDDASLRKTIRSQILTPEDIDKVNEVIAITSTASESKLDAYLRDVDRAYVLSSNTKSEQDRVRSNRDSRDATGQGLYGRKPGTTRGADTDFGLEETILRDELGKKATVLGRKKDSFGLRRKKENELPEIVQAGGFYMGGFAPPTRGHRGALDTLLNNMLAKNPSASLEDILVSVAPDLPMIVGKEGIDHAARYGIFPADLRTLFGQMNFGDAMISTQSQTGGGLPKFMEVTGAGDRRKFARLKGAMAITSGKDDKTLGKYQRAGIDVKDIPRIEDISATAVRDALFQGDDKTLTSLMNPDIASILMGNRAQLRNRSTMVPMLIEEIQKFVDQEKIRSNDEVSQILSNAPGGPYGNVSADLKKNYPEIADQVKKIRDKRDQVSKGAFGYRAFNIIRALSAKYPDMYGLDPSRRSSVSAKPSDVSKEIIAAQLSEQMSGEFGGIPTDMPSGLEEAILKNVEKATQVKKSSGILPAQGTEILKRFGAERLPNDPSFGPFAGKTVRDTADGGKLKYWNSAFRPETKADKLAYYTVTRDYLIDKFNQSQGTQKATTLAATTSAVLSSKQLGLVGLNPLGYTGLLGPETWNLGVDSSGQERSIDASIVQRGLPNQYQNVIDYLSGQTEEIVGGASKLLGISPKKLTKKQRETLGQGNIEGALLEQIFGSADATILDDALRTRPIDFPMGIGAKAAKIFGIDPDIPTEVKRTIDSGSRGKAVEEFQRYFRQQYGIPDPTKEELQKLASGGKVKLYHGSNTGVDDSVLNSFKEKGALSNIASGYGQGAGFYLYTEKNKAEQQAKMRVGGGSGFTVTSGDTSGKPMVLSFDETLDPKTYDLDYELQKNLVTQWLHDNFDKIKDKAAPDKEKGLAGIRDIIAKDASKGVMSAGIKVQSAEGSRKALYAGGDSNIREGEILGQIMNRLQSGDPELVNSFESELFKRPLGLALKYTGSNPLKPTNIETFAQGGQAGISSKDTVPALLTPGEFVINKKAAQNIGYGKLERLNKADKIQGYNKGGIVAGGVIQRFATGGSVFSIEAIMQGLKGLAEPAVQKLKTRPETIDSKSIEASSELFNNVKLLAQGFEEAGYSMISFNKVLDKVASGADISYNDIEKAMTKDVERLKITGASIDTIIAAEKALKTVRDQSKTAIVKRQFLEAGLKESKTGKVLGSGGAQQAILTEAEKKEKLITAQRKSQIEKDLIKKDPSLLGDKDKLERRTNRRLEKEQRQIKEQAFTSATEKVTGIKRSELSGMGIGGSDIQSYVSQSMTDRKTLAQMDKQLIAMKTEELTSSAKYLSASAAEQQNMLSNVTELAKEEVRTRREMINEMAAEQGEKGVGAADFMDFRNSPIKKAVQERYFSGTMSQGIGTALGDVGMVAGLVGGQGKNIANLMYDTSTDEGKIAAAGKGAAIEQAGSTLATGLTTASQLMAINPLLGGLTALGTVVYAATDYFTDFTGAQETAALEMEKNLRFEEVAASEKDLAKAFKDFEKDLGNIDLQKALDKALVRSSESSLKAISAETKVAQNEKGKTRTWTEFLSGAEKPKMDTQDFNELDSKIAERNADSGDKAFALISQRINTGASLETIQADKELIGARRALVLADEDALKTVRARIASEGGYDKVSQQRQDAILDEVANEKILTNTQLQTAVKTKQMSDALDAADKAGRRLAASFEKLSSIVSESVNRIKFESDVRKSSAEQSRSSLRGQSEDRGPKLRELNVLENPNAYSEQDFNDALQSATAGVDEKTRNQLIGGAQLQQQLPNAITKSIADKLSNKRTLGVDEAKAEAVKTTNEQIDKTNLSDEQKASLKKQAETRINKLAQDAKDKNDTPEAEVDAFREGLGDSSNILGDFGIKTLEAVKALSSFKQGALADFSEGLRESSKAAKDAQNYFKKARDIRTQGNMNLREVMTGVGESYDEKQARIMGDVAGLAGGETTVGGIKNRMVDLQGQRTAVEEKRQGMSDPNELKRSAEELRSLDDQLRDTREALDTLASSTELVEQAFNDLKNVRELQKNRESFVNTLLTNTPEEADKLNKTFIRLQRNLSGGLNTAGNQRDARKAFNQTLRETGSVREATKAGNTVLANQRKETLALSQDSGVRAAQELQIRNQYAQQNKPGADQAVADYFKQQQLQLTKSMAIESGMMNNPLVRQSIAAMENPNADPAMKEASSKYLQSVGLQADATKAQGELALLESQQALVSANANLKVSIDDLRTTIEASMLNNDTNEGRVNAVGDRVVNPGVAVAAPVAARARGGLIYASEGQLVNFQPQGTDTVPAMLTPGEFVINARSTAEHLPLLKAINSGNYSKGGVVYLAQGGSVNPEAQKRKEERIDAQKESWMMSEATGRRPDEVVSRTSSSWAQSQVGDGRWMGMTEDERQSEAKKYEPEFQSRWDNYNNRQNDAQLRSANDAGYGSIKEDPNSGIVGVNFYNEEKKRATERFEKASAAENEALNNPIAQTPLSPQEFSQPVIQPSLSVPLVKAEVVPWGRGTTTKIRPTQEAIDEKKKIKSEELRRRSLWLKGSKGRSPEEETEYVALRTKQGYSERISDGLSESEITRRMALNAIHPDKRTSDQQSRLDAINYKRKLSQKLDNIQSRDAEEKFYRAKKPIRRTEFNTPMELSDSAPITSNGGKPGSVDPAMVARMNEGYSRPSNTQQAAEQNAVIESGIRQQYTTARPDITDPAVSSGVRQGLASQTNTSVNLRTPEIKNEDERLGVNIGPMVPSPRVSLPGDYVAGSYRAYGIDPNPRFESQKTTRDRESSRRDSFGFPLGSPSNTLATETMIKYPNQLSNSQIAYQHAGATDPLEYSNDPKIRANAETQNVYRTTASPGLSSSIQTATTSRDTKQKREADSAIASTKIGIEKRAQIAAQEQAFDVEFNQKLESSRSGKDPNTYAMEDDPEEREKYKKGRRQQVINERNQAKLDAQTAEIDNKFNKFLAEGKVKENQREQYRTEQRSYMPKPYMESAKNYKVPTTEQLLQDQANSEAIAQFEGAQQATAAEKVRAQQQKAEEDRQASLYINSSNPAIAAAGYVGGVTQGIGDALYGAANITAGAVATVASPIVGGIGYAMSGDDTAFQIGDENNLRNRTAENMYDEARANGRPMPSPQEIAAAQDAAVIRARVFTENSNRLNNQPGAYSAATRAAAEVGVNAMGAGAMSFVEAGQAVAGMGPIQNGTETALQRNDARNVELAGGMDSYSGFATAGFQTAGYASSQAVGALINAEGAVTNVAGRAISSGARMAGRVVPGAAGAGRVAGRVAGTVDRAITGTARGAGRLGGRIPGASGAGRAVNNFVEGVQDVATQMGDVIGVRGIAPDWAGPRVKPTTQYAPTSTAASAASAKNAKQGTIYVKPRPGQTQTRLGYDPAVNASPQKSSTVYVKPKDGQVPDATPPGSGSVDDSLRTKAKADADAKAKLDASKSQTESVNKARVDAEASAKAKSDAAVKAKADAAKIQDDAAAKTKAKEAAKAQQDAANKAKADAAVAKADAKTSTGPSKAAKTSSSIDSAKEMSKEEFLSKLSSKESSAYDILGVQPGTSLTSQEVRDLVRKYNKFTHPDLGGSAELQARLNKIVELASDPDSLSQYDMILKNGIRLKDGTIVRPSPDRLLSVWKTKKVKGQVVPFAQSSFADLAPAGTKAKSTASTATATQSTKKAPSKAELREQNRTSVRSSRQAERQSLAKMQKAELESMTPSQRAQMQAAREARLKPTPSSSTKPKTSAVPTAERPKSSFDSLQEGVEAQRKKQQQLLADKSQLESINTKILSLQSQEKKGFFGFGKVSKADEIETLQNQKRILGAKISKQEMMDSSFKEFLQLSNSPASKYYQNSDKEWKRILEGGINNEFRTYGLPNEVLANLDPDAGTFGQLRGSYARSRGIKISDSAANYSGFEGVEFNKAGVRVKDYDLASSLRDKNPERFSNFANSGETFYGLTPEGGVRIFGKDSTGRPTATLYNIPADEVDKLNIIKKLEALNMPKFNQGGIVYANNGALVPYLSQGTDTVPAMLTPGEFVVNREASQQHMPLLHAINSGHFNRGGIVNYLANGGIVAPKYYANAGPVTGGSGGSSGVSNDISSSISAAVGQAMNEAVGQLSTTLQSGMETYSQMMQSSTETLNNFGQTFSSASQTIASSANTWSETASQIPTSLTAEVTGRQVVDFTGLGKEGDRIVSSAAQAGQLAGSQTSQNTMAKYDRSQFDGNLNTAANNRPMRT